jgi:hypothetical protein
MDQDRDPNMNLCSYAHLIFDTGEKTASSTSTDGKTGCLNAEN